MLLAVIAFIQMAVIFALSAELAALRKAQQKLPQQKPEEPEREAKPLPQPKAPRPRQKVSSGAIEWVVDLKDTELVSDELE